MPRFLVGCACLLALGWFLVSTWHWPFAGDAAYIHYVVFLTRHGMAPYRDIIELNMPCTYLIERIVMTVYGESALGWRLFDFTLLAISCISCIAILKTKNWEAAFFASTLFATVHGQDGVMFAGERDLQVAVFQIAALACLLCGLRTEQSKATQQRRAWLWFFVFGLLASLAACIKPPAILFPAATLAWIAFSKSRQHSLRRLTLPTALGAMLPVFASFAYLEVYKVVLDFWKTLRGLIAYHAQLERKPLSFLLPHSLSPVMVLFVLFVVLLVLQRGRLRTLSTSEFDSNSLLAVSAAAGWLMYALQGKGFSYQRYPFLIFLFPLMASIIFTAIKSSSFMGWIARISVATGIALIALAAYRAGTFSHADPYRQMSSDLHRFGSDALSSAVQCMDTSGGCIATLYEDRLVQSTGTIYDCYLIDASDAVVQDLRRHFESSIQSNPPRAFIVTDSVCFGGKRSFDKFETWPFFNETLAEHYQLVAERHFTMPIRYWTHGDVPYDYRIYLRK